jgi:hypothetical protein
MDGIFFLRPVDCKRDGMHFLHELRADHLGDGAAPGAGDEDAGVLLRYARLGFHALQKLEHLFRLSRVVALVVLPEHARLAREIAKLVCGGGMRGPYSSDH